MPFSPEQIASLAPDEASLKAAKGLVAPGKWPTLGANEEALWASALAGVLDSVGAWR